MERISGRGRRYGNRGGHTDHRGNLYIEVYIYLMYILYGLLTDGEQDIHLADKDVLAVG